MTQAITTMTPGARVEYRFWPGDEFAVGTVMRVWDGCSGGRYVDIDRDGHNETAVMPIDKATDPEHVRLIGGAVDPATDLVATSHTTIVQREGSIGGYPAYRALCSCCGIIGPRYVAAHAAQAVADDHTATPYQRHMVSYRRTERGTMQPVPGSVTWATRDASRAIDLTAEQLRADDDTVSFVITAVKAVV